MDMVRVPAAGVSRVLTAIFKAAGASPDEAQVITDNLVEATLQGHDSHGVVRTPRYVLWAQRGDVKFGQTASTVVDADAFALLDGNHGYGQSIGLEAVAVGLEKVARQGVSIVAVRRAGHLGRIGHWSEIACEKGIASIHFVNVKNSLLVAPFGGAGRRLSTAPFAVGVPHLGPDGARADFILDFATSKIAEGKAYVALKSGKNAPEGALIDGEGRPVDDPFALYGTRDPAALPDPREGPGALAAMGDHKGSGLGLACELLAGALTGSGTAGTGQGIHNGMLSIYIDPERFDDGYGWASEVRSYIEFVQSCPPAIGLDRVLTPGEPERIRRVERMRDGLPLAPAVWESILATAAGLGLDRDQLARDATA